MVASTGHEAVLPVDTSLGTGLTAVQSNAEGCRGWRGVKQVSVLFFAL